MTDAAFRKPFARPWLYVSCRGTGELKQHDGSDPAHPREAGAPHDLDVLLRHQPLRRPDGCERFRLLIKHLASDGLAVAHVRQLKRLPRDLDTARGDLGAPPGLARVDSGGVRFGGPGAAHLAAPEGASWTRI